MKAVILAGGQVPLLRNEREEWELPGGRIEAGETPADALDEIALPEPYPSGIRAGMLRT